MSITLTSLFGVWITKIIYWLLMTSWKHFGVFWMEIMYFNVLYKHDSFQILLVTSTIPCENKRKTFFIIHALTISCNQKDPLFTLAHLFLCLLDIYHSIGFVMSVLQETEPLNMVVFVRQVNFYMFAWVILETFFCGYNFSGLEWIQIEKSLYVHQLQWSCVLN